MPELLEQDRLAAQLARDAADLDRQAGETAADIIELQAYIREVALAIESGLAAELAAAELEEARQLRFMERLKQNLIDAREALLLAMERQRRQNNARAAAAAVIHLYY
jgi:hypothetical protein